VYNSVGIVDLTDRLPRSFLHLIPKYEYGAAYRQCPQSFECVYDFKKRRPSAQEIIDGLKGGG